MEYKLPNDILVEKSLLGAMLISEQALITCLGSLVEDDFYEKNAANRVVFQAIKRLNDNHNNVDVVTVYSELENMKKQEIVGVDYLHDLSENAIGLTSLEHYIKMLKDCTLLRSLLIKMEDIKEKYNKGIDGTVSDFVAQSGDEIASIVAQRRVAEFISLNEYVQRVNQDLMTYKETREDHLIGITTGFRKLDNLTNGFQKENMIVLAARPSVGKTALALNFALTAARSTGKTVAFFSLEMSGDLLARRILAIDSGVELNKITTGYLNKEDRLKIKTSTNRLANMHIHIDDTPSIKMADLIAKARKFQNNHNDLAMILIDYIGLITSSDKPKGDFNRQLEVSDFSRKIKDLARTLKVPVVVLCQLSRDVEKRENKEPVMSDLRESGAIEQDADLVILLSPDGMRKKKEGAKGEDQEEKDKNSSLSSTQLVRVNLAKNRNGQTDVMTLLFQKQYSLFSELTEEQRRKLDALRAGKIQDFNDDLKEE
ncbi:MAG: replicative DNA helicase [Erysipelotrichales bacterium]|nr:replicative DNA helicase [Erysipelotrichales bacterium]